MPFFDTSEILQEISEPDLARLTGDPTGYAVQFDRIEYARNNADTIIYSYLTGRYDMSVTDIVEPLLKKISIDLTICNLYEYAYCKTVIPNTIVWKRMNAISLLKDVQAGNIALAIRSNMRQQPPPIITNKQGQTVMFDDNTLNEYLGE